MVREAVSTLHLWNVVVGRVLRIDFERSGVNNLSNHQKHPSSGTEVLRAVPSNKKRRRSKQHKQNGDQGNITGSS
jgi:hypothetical protein